MINYADAYSIASYTGYSFYYYCVVNMCSASRLIMSMEFLEIRGSSVGLCDFCCIEEEPAVCLCGALNHRVFEWK